ncbi:MAG: protein kinase [Pseudomonadota bacterium]|nr:protein kinase [Pseudomonadota bacterium]
MHMTPVRPQAGLKEPESADETAIKRGLDALASGACDEAAFLASMQAIFESDPEASWEVLSQLDQYYRRGRIQAEVFHALKKSLEESALRTTNSRGAQDRPVPRESAAPRESLPLEPPVPRESAAPREPVPPESPPAESAPRTPLPPPKPLGPRASAAPRHPPTAREPVLPLEDREPTAAPMPIETGIELKPGAVLRRRYRLQNILSRGRLGTVFEALDEYRLESAPGVHIAIKVLHTGAAKRAESLNELRQEFQQLQLLSHPNIVRVFEFDRDGAVAFFTMELLEGTPLSRVLEGRKLIPLERSQALAVLRDTGAAIAYAHSRGVVHGNISPQNIFVTHPGDLRVLGFAAARGLQHSSPSDYELTLPFPTSGNASCQVLEGEEPDPSDDIFSLACTAYWLLSGTHPFLRRTAIEARQAGVKPRRPPQLSSQQWQALRAGLRWDRKGRPTDMQKWLEQLELGGAAKHLAPLADLLEAPEPEESYHGMDAAAALAVALIIAAFFWFVSNRGQTGINSGTPAPITRAPAPAQAETSHAASPPLAPPPSMSPPPTSPPPTVNATAPATTTPVAPSVSAPPAAVPWVPPKLEMAADTVDVPSAESSAEVTVRRKGSLRGETNFTWWTESGTAKPGIDFSPVVPQLAYIGDGKSSITLNVPLKDAKRTQPKSFYIVIDQSEGGAATGARTLTMVTLLPSD